MGNPVSYRAFTRVDSASTTPSMLTRTRHDADRVSMRWYGVTRVDQHSFVLLEPCVHDVPGHADVSLHVGMGRRLDVGVLGGKDVTGEFAGNVDQLDIVTVASCCQAVRSRLRSRMKLSRSVRIRRAR